MANRGCRSEKVKRIFQHFDVNKDGGLGREEMEALVVAVNSRVKFSQEQINAILEEVFKTYAEFIDGDKGLTYEGLLRTYDDGAGDVDRDFEALDLTPENPSTPDNQEPSSPAQPQNPPENHGIVFDETWKIVDDLESLIRGLKSKQDKDGKSKGDNSDAYSDPGWSKDFGQFSDISEKRVFWEESSPDYAQFVKDLGVLRSRADGSRSREEAFDGQMAIAKVLYEHHFYKEALVSFKRASELQPTDVRPHFRAGNCFYILDHHAAAKQEFLAALEAAEAGGSPWSHLLPQIHVNLGISLEGEGMVLSACEHYREAAILCPTHFRALKLLGSALFGIGEYKAAVKALEESVYLKHDYADAHCDLASALHALAEDDTAIHEFQKAIDLNPSHVDALYNLGGLYMDMGRYNRAAEMYARVLGEWPNHWRAQLNKAVSLLGAGESEEAKKALKEALKMTNRVELHNAIEHMKVLKKKKRLKGDDVFIVVEASRFHAVGDGTARREELANALEIRAFQRITGFGRCNVELVKKEMSEDDSLLSYSGCGTPTRSIRKASLEEVIKRLLNFLKPETFVGAVKAINQKILSVLDDTDTGRVDLGMFLAVVAPICNGSPERRKKIAFDALLWRPVNEEGSTKIRKADAVHYMKLLRAIYLSQVPIVGRETAIEEETSVSFGEFLMMFDDPETGFGGVMPCLLKVEGSDRIRHGRHVCSTCRYPIIGSRFKEMKSHFSLCSQCYSEGKVPSGFKMEEYRFKEYAREAEAVKEKCLCFNLQSKSSSSISIPI